MCALFREGLPVVNGDWAQFLLLLSWGWRMKENWEKNKEKKGGKVHRRSLDERGEANGRGDNDDDDDALKKKHKNKVVIKGSFVADEKKSLCVWWFLS